MKVQNGKVISIYYSLRKDRDDKLIASSMRKPYEFIYGEKRFILGLDKELLGLRVGEQKTVTILPENGYGLREQKRILSLKRSQIPDNIEIQNGMTLKRKTKSGKILKGIVKSFDSQQVTIDLNHPLAGETLQFKTKIVQIRDATKEDF